MPLGYSDKVIELFKNPKNMGSIKDADGVGKAGNPICVPPNTMIHVNDMFVGIEHVDNSTTVLGHDGFFNKVQRTFLRDYSGQVISIKNKLGITLLTPEHIVLAIKVPKVWKCSYARGKKTLIAEWCHAEELEKGDLTVYPVVKEVVDRKFIETSQEKKKWDHSSVKIPEKIKVGSDFLRFCGYYLAEGYLKEEITKTYLSFAFNIKEDDLVDDVERIARKIFGIEPKRKVVKERRTVVVTINNVFVVRLIKSLFGKGAADKKIPHWMMLLPVRKQESLIYGLWWGDGYFNAKRPRAGYSTISYQLAQQMRILLLRNKIAPSVYVEKEKISKDGMKYRKAYRLHIEEKKYLERLAKILGIDFIPKRPEAISSWFSGDYLFTPITKVDKISYSGEVHNLEIEKSKSYVTESMAVHNCGDVMKIYIKIGKNKKNQEIIKNVKVETLGCVAALSSSSILTEMVKGKTVDYALSVTKDQVVKKLGGLPAVKYHCSVLAVDALKNAIKNYRENKSWKEKSEDNQNHIKGMKPRNKIPIGR